MKNSSLRSSPDRAQFFPAELGGREKLVTYMVGIGVGLGLTTLMAILFAFIFSQPLLLLLPLPFAIAISLAAGYRPQGFELGERGLIVRRAFGGKAINYHEMKWIKYPMSEPKGVTIRLLGVDGIFGSFGHYWNRSWGRFQVYVTDVRYKIEIGLHNGSRVVLSPSTPIEFQKEIIEKAARGGVRLEPKSF